MNLIFENIGDIKKASINFKKLTVISGENDVGKSTVGKLMFAIVQSCNTYNEVYQKEHPRSNLLYSWIYSRITEHESLASNIEIRSFFSRLRMDSNRKYDFDKIIEKIDYFITIISDLEGQEFLNKLKDVVSDFYNEAMNFEYSSADGLLNIINNEFRNNAVRYGMKNAQITLLNEEDSSDFHLDFKFSKREKIQYFRKSSFKLRDVTILENPAILQYLPTIFSNSILNSLGTNKKYENIGVPYHVIDLWGKLKNSSIDKGRQFSRDLFEIQLEDGFSLSNIESVADLDKESKKTKYIKNNIDQTLISSFFEGELYYVRQEHGFIFKKKDKVFNINNISSGVKSLAILDLLLKGDYINKDTLLILDEPETNLHPAWKKKYAEVVAKLCDSGANILINTHSPYMVESLRGYSEKYNVPVNFYLAQRDSDSNEINFLEKNGDISQIINVLAQPLRDLNNELSGLKDDY